MTISLAQLQILARERRPQERVPFDDILQKVFDELPFARQELAERLAARADAPRRVVAKLAADTIAVAAPMLTHSPVLQDDASRRWRRRSPRIICLPSPSTRGCRNGSPTFWSIAATPWCSIRLPKTSGHNSHNRAARPWSPRHENARHFGSGSPAAVDLADCIAYQMAPALADPMAAETSAPRLRAATALARPLDELMTFMAEGRLRLCDVLIELADADRVFDLAQLICGRASVESHVFVRYLFAPNVEPLMKVCRAALMDIESFSAIMEPLAFPTSIVRSSPVRSQKQFASKIERQTSNVKAAFASHRPGRDGGSCRACHSSSTDCRRGLKNQCPDVHMHAHERAPAAARSPQPVFRIRSARDDFH